MTSHDASHLQTRAIHSGVYQDTEYRSVTTPIYPSSCFAFKGLGEPPPFDYGRSGNPTRQALNENLATLEEGCAAFAVNSGMAAIHTASMLLSSGDHVVCGLEIYGGTHRLFNQVLPRLGLEFSHVDMTDLEQISSALRPETRLIWIETPSNPLLNLIDIQAVAQLARERGILTAVDNTFLSPALQQPLKLGADIVVHSTSKYLSGHSDVIGGAIITNQPELADQIGFLVNALGVSQSPFDAWLILRGIKTLVQRIECAQRTAGMLAEQLKEQPGVKRVLYPGLPEHPQHKLAKQQQRGFGAIVTLECDLAAIDLDTFFKSLRRFSLSVSLGGIESLIEQPASMSHATFSEKALQQAGITPGIVRISVGCEHPEDLLSDLKQALKHSQKTS